MAKGRPDNKLTSLHDISSIYFDRSLILFVIIYQVRKLLMRLRMLQKYEAISDGMDYFDVNEEPRWLLAYRVGIVS